VTAATRHYGAVIVTTDPAAPDARTTLADLRTALCIASGIALDDIDPAQGYDTSRRSFDAARASWGQGPLGLTSERMRTGYERATAYWQARRPEWMTDWPTPATDFSDESALGGPTMPDQTEPTRDRMRQAATDAAALDAAADALFARDTEGQR
jgi:hypothetical protein